MSPKSLVYVIERLTYQQFIALSEIGFGGFFWLRVKQLPLQLGYWLLDNFSPYRNCVGLVGNVHLDISAFDAK